MNIFYYKNIIIIFLLVSFLNINVIFYFTSNYMLSYFVILTKDFNYVLFKLILPFYTVGIFLGGLSIMYFIDIFGYKKMIQVIVILIGLLLICMSYILNIYL